MKPIIDIHSHILPGVDDGCPNRTEALVMLRMYEEQGVEAVICTPHFGPCGIPGADVDGAFAWLREQSSTVKLYLGNEALYGSFEPDKDIVKPGGPRTLAGSRALLLEFDEWGNYHTSAKKIVDAITRIRHFWHDVIIAHPERYKSMREKPDSYKTLTELGVRLQINAYDIYDTPNEETKEATQWLLNERLVSFIGSDAHGATRRAPMLKNGVQWIYDHCPEDYADAIVHDNAAKLIRENEDTQHV